MLTSSSTVDQSGFADGTREAQQVFRCCLQALSRPAIPVTIATALPRIGGMAPASAAVLLALADFETAVWLDAAARATPDISAYLRFHTGARICASPADADFALVLDPTEMPPLGSFKQGTPDYPDRSTSVLMQVARLYAHGQSFKGPGIDGKATFWAAPLPRDFPEQLARNRRCFPCGVDLLFVAGNEMAGLPRSAAIQVTGSN